MDAHSRRAGMMDYALRVKELNLQALRLADERISQRWLEVDGPFVCWVVGFAVMEA